MISNPRVIELKEIRKVLADETERLGVAVTQSQNENLLRMVSTQFKELEFMNYQQNKVLVYPTNLKIESSVIDNFEQQSDLNQTLLGHDPKTVMNAATVLNEKIKKFIPLKYHGHRKRRILVEITWLNISRNC